MDNKNVWQTLMEGDAALAEKTSEQVVKYSLGTGNTALYCCILWPGMLLWANDVRDKYLPADEEINTSFVTINYCLEGRCSCGCENCNGCMQPAQKSHRIKSRYKG